MNLADKCIERYFWGVSPKNNVYNERWSILNIRMIMSETKNVQYKLRSVNTHDIKYFY